MTTLVMVGVLFFGIYAYKKMPVSDLPDVAYPTITVSANQPGGSPEYMANTVATPLERSFATISGLSVMTSNNTNSTSTIVLNFDLGIDINAKEVEVQSSISQTLPDLPPMPNNPTFQKTNPSETPILFMTLTSDSLTLGKLYEYAYDIISQPISMIEGISQVQTYGYPYAVRVRADPMKLMARQLDLPTLSELLVEANPNLPGGLLYGPHTNVQIEAFGQGTNAALYNEVILREEKGIPLYVENVGKAIDGLQYRFPYFQKVTKEAEENCVVLAVTRLADSNTMDIIRQIKEKLPSLERTLPGSVNLGIFYDKSSEIIGALHDVELTLLIAFGLVVIVIFISLGKLVDGLIPSLVLPLALLAAFVLMFLSGFTVDSLSLLALTLAIGFMVDDAVVVLENIVRHVEMGKPRMQAALDGSKEISVTVFTMTIALGSVFIPLIWMPGMLGRIFREFSLTILFAILCSGFLSLMVNPMLCSRFLTGKEKKEMHFSHTLQMGLLNFYIKILRHTLHWRKSMLLIALLSIGASLWMIDLLPFDFLPQGNINMIRGLTQAAQGSSNLNTIAHQKRVNKVLRQSPYVDRFITIAGYPTNDQGLLFLHLLPPSKRPNASRLSTELMIESAIIPGINVFLKPFPFINLQVGTGTSVGQYQYVIWGRDAPLLYKSAGHYIRKMREMPEFVGVNTDMRIKSPQLNVQIDRERAGLYGITAQAIEETLQYAYSGGRISTFNLGTNLYDLILEVEPGFDLTTSDLDLLYIQAPNTEKLVPLTSVASWDLVPAPSSVNHLNIFPSVTISFDLAEGVNLGTVVKKLNQLADEILPREITGEVQGSAQVFVQTFKAIAFLGMIAFFVIYLLLGILYESFIHPLTVISTLPVAIVGGLLTLWLFDQPLSLYSIVGLVVLVGLVQKNGIMLIDFALETMKDTKITAEEAVFEACQKRFRPIIMTTVAAIMGALPVAIGIGSAGDTNRPLGLVVVGGLLFSQLITLFVTPVIFLYMHRLQSLFKR